MTNTNFILTLLVMFYQETVWTMDISRSVLLCFGKQTGQDGGWCNSTLMLCNTGIAQNIIIEVTFINTLNVDQCKGFCDTQLKPVMSNDIHNLSEKCLRMECNMTNFKIPSYSDGNGNDNGFVNVTYSCTDNTAIAEEADNITTITSLTILTSINSEVTTTTTETLSTTTLTSDSTTVSTTILSTASTGSGSTQRGDSKTPIGSSITPGENNTTPTVESTTQIGESITSIGHSTEPTSPPSELTVTQIRTDSYTVAIVVSVVVPIVIVVVVVAILMYRRGQCQLLIGKCTKSCAKHSSDRTDTHDMSSTVNSNLYCDLKRDIDTNDRDVDYCEIDMVGKESDLKYVN